MEIRLPSRRALGAIYVACGIVAGGISYGLGQARNLEVYRHAARALLFGRDLYDGSSVDWFKYSPTFALLFLPFAMVPAWVASVLWGALNFGVAFLGLNAAAGPAGRRARIALLTALPGILLSTDGDQANLLVAGAMLLAFASFVRGKSLVGAAFVAGAALVKIFPIAAALFVFLQRDRGEHERAMFRIILAIVVGLALPMVVIWHPSALFAQLHSWAALVRADHATRGWSLVTVARDFGLPGSLVQIFAAVTLSLPVIACFRGAADREPRLRRAFAATVLVLVVLCNHRSEYTSFVISSLGVGLWFANGSSISSPWRIALLTFASVAHGPMMLWRDHLNPLEGTPLWFFGAHRDFHPLRLAPLVIVWCLLQVDLLRLTFLAPSSSTTAKRPTRDVSATAE